MKTKFITLRTFLLFSLIVPAALFSQTGNVGVGTTSPTTKLDVNGGLTTREAAAAITVGAGPVAINNLAYSQYRLTGATAPFTITGPTNNGSVALVAGARLVIVNASGQTGTLNGFAIPTGTAQEFSYSGGAWIATNSGGSSAKSDYDWLKAGRAFPTNPADSIANIFHLGGNVGIGTDDPTSMLDVDSGNAELSLGYALRWGPDNTGERLFTRPGLGVPGNNLYIESREHMYFIADRNNTVDSTSNVGFVWAHDRSWEDGTPRELMRLSDNGYLGIGTDSATSKLDVDSGNIELNHGFEIRWWPDNTGERIYSRASLGITGNNLYLESREYMFFIADNNNTGAGGNGPGFIWANDRSWENGTPREMMRLNDGGYLGVGTANPLEKLHVETAVDNEGIALSQTARTNTIMLNSNAGGGYLGFINNNTSTDAALTGFIQQREPGATGGQANDLVYNAGGGTHFFVQPIGINTAAPASGFWLDVNGNVQCNNIQLAAYAGTTNREIGVNAAGSIIIFASDGHLKKNITNISSSLSKVMKLRPVKFGWKDTKVYGEQEELGFIAQEVMNVIPEVSGTFKKDGEEYHTIAYSKLVPVLTKAMQEQQAIIDAQSKRIVELESKVADADARLQKLEQMMNVKPKLQRK